MNDTTNKTITLPVKVLLVAGELFIALGAGFGGGAFGSNVNISNTDRRISTLEVQLGGINKEIDHAEKERNENIARLQSNSQLLSSLVKMAEIQHEKCQNTDERLRYLERKMK